ncbi:MAG: hypothetical protein ACREA0_28925, partial [bacterium]
IIGKRSPLAWGRSSAFPSHLMYLPLLLLQSAVSVTTLTGTFRSPRLTESSGVVVSRAHPGILWTHNDSGDGPYLYATDLHGTDRGAIFVPGAEAVDWEDMALGPCPRRPVDCLYIGDTGDNLERREHVTVYAVPEPDPPLAAADTQRVSAAALALSLYYPDGPHDVEALYVSPRDTALYLVSKGRGRRGEIRLYRVARAAWDRPNRVRAEFVQTLPIVPDRATGRVVTGAAMRADGGLVAIRTYTEIYFFSSGPGGSLSPANRPVCSIAQHERPGESIAFREDSSIVLTSEANPLGRGTIHTVRCPAS